MSELKPCRVELPAQLDGHWDTPEGREIAQDYLAMDRHRLCMGDKSDLALANAQYLEDISVGTFTFQSAIGMQTAAKERIRWLSAHLAASRATEAELLDALEGLMPSNFCISNPNIPDNAIVPVDFHYGDFRKLHALITKHRT